ncbi:hypothetical protein JCM8097_008202 [Rhodosporidiobolus ruineniae]
MLYVATSQPASAQLQALRLPFFSADSSALVVNKLTRLEFHEVSPADGSLKLVDEVRLHGGVAAMEAVQLPNHPTASLLVLTTSLQLFCLSYSPTSTPSITTLSSVSFAEPFARLSEYQAILVAPDQSVAVIYAYDGLIRVVPLRSPDGGGAAAGAGKKRRASAASGSGGWLTAVGEDGALDLGESYNVRLQTLNVLSLAFLPAGALSSSDGPTFPALAVLATTPGGTKTLTTHTLNLANKELDDSNAPIEEVELEDAGSEVLIPVHKGVLVVGEESVTYYEASPPRKDEEDASGKGKGRAADKAQGSPKKAASRLPISRITAYTLLTPTTLLLGDLYGKLLLVTLNLSSSSAVKSLTVRDLGDATSATSIVPLPGSQVYLSSRFGDSQIVRLPSGIAGTEEKKGDGMEVEGEAPSTELELVESYTGLAPIVDAVVLGGAEEGGESGSSSASSLLVLSGAYKTGSLRLLRRGVGLTTLASLEIDGVQRVWSVTRSAETLLVMGFFDETRVFRLAVEKSDDGEEEVDLEELDDAAPFSSAGTLLAASVGGVLVHVTPAGLEADIAGGQTNSWRPAGGKRVTTAVAREDKVALAVEGGQVVVLEVKDGELVEVGSTTFDTDVSALALSAPSSSSPSLLAVALWTPSQTVHLLSLPSLDRIASHTLSSTFLIRSLALPTFPSSSSADEAGSTILLCGLGDGSLTTFTVTSSGAFDTKSEKTVQLGKRPLQLTEFEQAEGGGEPAVFVASETPTVVTMAKGGRLSYASVNATGLSSIASLPIPGSPPLLALASPTSLTLGRLSGASASGSASTGSQIDVRTIPLDEDEPRRIAHDRKGRAFAVVCSRRDVDRETGEQSTVGKVRVIEEEDFSTRASLTLPPNEEGQSVCAVHLPLTPAGTSLFLLGTTKLDLTTPQPTEGRLVLLRSTNGSDTIEQVASRSVGGCPYAVVPLVGAGLDGEYVAAAVNSQVAVFRLVTSDEGELDLQVVAAWSGAFVALSLAAGPDGTLVVGDALRSITVLRFSLPSSSASSTGTAPRPKLEELGKDYRSRYMVGVEALSSVGETQRFLGAETDLNLFTVERDPQAGVRNLADAGTLTPAGAFHLGEMVTRFRHGSFGQLLSSSSDSPSSGQSITPQLVFTTSAGSVGVVLDLDARTSKVLSDLERNMRAVEAVGKSIGGLEQEEFRTFKSDKLRLAPRGFIDGVFVEQFLDLPVEVQDEIVKGKSEHERVEVEGGREEVVRLVEEVARAH